MAVVLLFLGSSGFGQDAASVWQHAQSALKRRAYAEAEAGFRQFLQLEPSVAEGHVNLGLSLHLQKKNSAAIESFRRAIRLQPKLAHAYLFLGIDLFNINNTADAIVELKKYVKMAPGDPHGHYYLGLSFAARGETEQAMQALETATELAPRDVDVLYHLAQTYITLANNIVMRVAGHDPSLALLRTWEKSQQDGISDLIRRSPAATADKGTLLSLKGRLGRTPPDLEAEQLAAAAYANLYLQTTRRFVEIQPDSFRIRQLLAAYYEKTGETHKAIQELQGILKENVNARGVHFALGSILKDQHQPERALEHFQQELTQASPEPETRVQMAQAYVALQQNEKALQELRIAKQQVGENNGAYWRTLGKVYTALEKHEDAAASYEKALTLGPQDRALLYQLGQSYRRIGKTDLARKMLAASNDAAKEELEKQRIKTNKAIESQRQDVQKTP